MPLGPLYRTGDVAMRDEDGYVTFVGRADDVFKASDYRISPFELESVLIEHPAVAEAGVIPAPDPIRLAVPKAFIALVPGKTAVAGACLRRLPPPPPQLAPVQSHPPDRVRQGPAQDHLRQDPRASQLRAAELGKDESGWERGVEFAEDDFPDLKKIGEREQAAG